MSNAGTLEPRQATMKILSPTVGFHWDLALFNAILYWVYFQGMLETVTGNGGKEFILVFPENRNKDLKADIKVAIDPTDIELLGVTVKVNVTFQSPIEILEADLNTTDTPYYTFHVTKSTRFFPPGYDIGQQYVARVQASEMVTVEVSCSGKSNTDDYLAIPVNLLGTTYYALTSDDPINADTEHSGNCFIAVASTTAATVVTITLPEFLSAENTLPFNDVEYVGGESICISLLPLEAFQIQTKWDMTGTRIESDVVVAVWGGLDRAQLAFGNSQSHVIMQTPHVGMAGRQFVFHPVPVHEPKAEMRVLAVEPWALVTTHFFNGSTATYHMAGKGSFLRLPVAWSTDKTVYVESSRDILVYRLSSEDLSENPIGGQCMTALAPLEKPLPTSQMMILEDKLPLKSVSMYVSIVTDKNNNDHVYVNQKRLDNALILSSYQTFPVHGRSDLDVVVMNFDLSVMTSPGYGLIVSETTMGGFTGVVDIISENDGQSHILGYPLVSANQTTENSYVNDVTDCCVVLNEHGKSDSTLYNNQCLDWIIHSSDPCCVFAHQQVYCRPIQRTYSCTLDKNAKTASDFRLVTSETSLHCFRACLALEECVGVNFKTDSGQQQPRVDNCQLLTGLRLGRSPFDSPWKHVDCTIEISFDTIIMALFV